MSDIKRMESNWILKGQQKREQYKEFFLDFPVGKSGIWSIEEFDIPHVLDMDALRAMRDGRTYYPGKYFRLSRNLKTIMSNTIAEIEDQIMFFKAAKGRILISGLGMGMTTAALAAKEDVTEIVVIEQSEDVIKLVGDWITNKFPKVKIIQGDINTVEVEGIFDYAWHDIWDEICGDNIPEFRKIEKRFNPQMKEENRQYFWGEEFLIAELHDEVDLLKGNAFDDLFDDDGDEEDWES